MTEHSIVDELRKLSILERLAAIEDVVQSIRDELQAGKELPTATPRERMAMAAQALVHEYATDPELTIWTSLDGEDIHA